MLIPYICLKTNLFQQVRILSYTFLQLLQMMVGHNILLCDCGHNWCWTCRCKSWYQNNHTSVPFPCDNVRVSIAHRREVCWFNPTVKAMKKWFIKECCIKVLLWIFLTLVPVNSRMMCSWSSYSICDWRKWAKRWGWLRKHLVKFKKNPFTERNPVCVNSPHRDMAIANQEYSILWTFLLIWTWVLLHIQFVCPNGNFGNLHKSMMATGHI